VLTFAAHKIKPMQFKLSIGIVLSLTLLAGCKEEKPREIKTPMGVVLDNPANHSPEFIKEVEKSISAYMDAVTKGTGNDVIEAYFAPSFIGTDIHEIAALFDSYEEQGMKQINNSWELRYISPQIDSLGMEIVVVRYFIDQELIFTEKFEGDPAIYEQQLKVSYGKENVTYFPDKRKYSYVGEPLAYAIKYKEDTEWKYLEDGFNMRVKGAIFPPELIAKMRAYAKYK
jgi:hypothetical protein